MVRGWEVQERWVKGWGLEVVGLMGQWGQGNQVCGQGVGVKEWRVGGPGVIGSRGEVKRWWGQ